MMGVAPAPDFLKSTATPESSVPKLIDALLECENQETLRILSRRHMPRSIGNPGPVRCRFF